MRNRPTAALVFLGLCACGRKEVEAPLLPSPPPSRQSVTIVAKTPFTNEMQSENLRVEAQTLGIRKFAPPGDEDDDDSNPPPPMTENQKIERTRAMARDVARQRMSFERGSQRPVDLLGKTPGLIVPPPEGAPIESSSAPAAGAQK